jgi:Tfp pilus assembly protein PilV
MMLVMVMGSLGLGGAQGKECCRYQQSHTQYLFVCCSLVALPEVLISSAARCAAALAGLPLQTAESRIRDAGRA